MKDEKEVKHDSAYIAGRTEGPFGSDDADVDRPIEDNKNQYEQENSANGSDSQQVRGGQDGRNERAIGSTDMDSKNGILRRGDTSNSTMEVTEEGLNSAIADEKQTNTATVDVTEEKSEKTPKADKVSVPNAQETNKAGADTKQGNTKKTETSDAAQQEREEDVAETGTDLNNKPTY